MPLRRTLQVPGRHLWRIEFSCVRIAYAVLLRWISNRSFVVSTAVRAFFVEHAYAPYRPRNHVPQNQTSCLLFTLIKIAANIIVLLAFICSTPSSPQTCATNDTVRWRAA